MRKTDRNTSVNGKSGFSFMSGFLAGLSVLTKPFDCRYTPPPLEDASVATAWRAVGGYMRTAMMGYDDEVRRRR
jgi:hypothetical protein